MNIIFQKAIETLMNVSFSFSQAFHLIGIKLFEKIEINLNKDQYGKKNHILLKNIDGKIDESNQRLDSLSESIESKENFKQREKIIKEILKRKLININNLNSISNSEYYIIIPKMHMSFPDDAKSIIFGPRKIFPNSSFAFLREQGFVDVGKTFTPIYIKNKNELKKMYQNIMVFKKIMDKKLISLWKKDNKTIRDKIISMKDDKTIKRIFYEKGKLRDEEYLFFDFMIMSSFNLNEDNLTLIDDREQDRFLSKILNQKSQEVKIEEILLKSGLKIFMNEEYPIKVKNKLLKSEKNIKLHLKIETFFDEINSDDLKNIFIEILGEDYKESYVEEFMKVHKLVFDFFN